MLKIIFFISLLILQSCGSVSSIRPTITNGSVDISSYNKIVINDFTNQTSNSEVDDIAKSNFPNKLFNKLSDSSLFKSVQRNKRSHDSLIISGNITKYEEGNAFLRTLFGFGAGRAYFYSDVDLIDGNSNKKIGTIEVRKKSWLLGGYIAGMENPETLMKDSVADIMEKIKTRITK